MRKIIGNRWYDTEKSTLLADGEANFYGLNRALYKTNKLNIYFIASYQKGKDYFDFIRISPEDAYFVFNDPNMKRFVTEEEAFSSVPEA